MDVRVNKPDHRGITHIYYALLYSLKGLRAAIRHEEAFRLELAAAAVLLPLAFLLGQDGIERALLAAAVMVVLIAELLNSAVETVVDRIGTETNSLSGRAKDIGSAAVFMALLNAALIWGAILYPRFF